MCLSAVRKRKTGVDGQFVKSLLFPTGLRHPLRHGDSPGEDPSGDRPDLEAGSTTARTATLPQQTHTAPKDLQQFLYNFIRKITTSSRIIRY